MYLIFRSEAMNGVGSQQAEQVDFYSVYTCQGESSSCGYRCDSEKPLLQMTIQASRTDRNSSAKSSLTCRLLGSSSSSLPSTEVSAVRAASASSLRA